MIVYNVTVRVELEIKDDWLEWMQKVHIPEVMATGMFVEHKIFRIIQGGQEGESYAIQYYCQDMKTLHQYQIHHAPALQADHIKRYGEKALAFRTLLEVVE